MDSIYFVLGFVRVGNVCSAYGVLRAGARAFRICRA